MLLYPGKKVRNIFHLKKKTLNKWTDAWRRETALFCKWWNWDSAKKEKN